MSITSQVIHKLRRIVNNQVRYVYPSEVSDDVHDYRYRAADWLGDCRELDDMMKSKPILSDDNLEELAECIGVPAIYDADGWVDGVADYIVEHAEDCVDLWNHLDHYANNNLRS